LSSLQSEFFSSLLDLCWRHVSTSICVTPSFRRRLKVGLLSSTLASIADSLLAEGPSDLICNQVTLHRRDLLDASSSSCRKVCLFLLEECSFPAALMILPITFDSWVFTEQKEIG